MIITDITKQSKRAEVRMIDEGVAFNVELNRYSKDEVGEVVAEVLGGLPSYDLPLGEEAEEDPQGLSDKDIREYIKYYAD